jgi:two-component system, LuxR family, response regulator FixJ
METPPTVVVVENDSDMPASTARVVDGLRVVVKRFSCPRETLDFCKPDMVGCFVLDQQVRDIGGLHLRQQLASQGCQQPFIFISRFGDVSSAVEAMHQGALDCIPKPFDRQRLLDRVQQAIAQDAATRRFRADRAIVTTRAQSLTPRETQILGLVAAGKITKEIARELAISPKTIEVHRSNIMKKMQVGSAAELLHLIAMHAVVSFSAGRVGFVERASVHADRPAQECCPAQF